MESLRLRWNRFPTPSTGCEMPSDASDREELLHVCGLHQEDHFAWVQLYDLVRSILFRSHQALPLDRNSSAWSPEDLTQEVWINFRKNPEKLDRWNASRGSFAAYVRIIARQLVLRASRRKRPKQAELDSLPCTCCIKAVTIEWDLSIREIRLSLTNREGERLDELLAAGKSSIFGDAYRRKLDERIKKKIRSHFSA